MSRRLLLVDDNQDAVETMAEALQLTGFEVAVANDGPTALGLVATFKPDTAILDIGLPVMDGYELGRKLRELLGPELRLIAVTGYGQERDRERTWQEGFTAHLVKPVDFDALDRVLSGVDDPLARREGGPGSTPMRTARPGAPDAGA